MINSASPAQLIGIVLAPTPHCAVGLQGARVISTRTHRRHTRQVVDIRKGSLSCNRGERTKSELSRKTLTPTFHRSRWRSRTDQNTRMVTGLSLIDSNHLRVLARTDRRCFMGRTADTRNFHGTCSIRRRPVAKLTLVVPAPTHGSAGPLHRARMEPPCADRDDITERVGVRRRGHDAHWRGRGRGTPPPKLSVRSGTPALHLPRRK